MVKAGKFVQCIHPTKRLGIEGSSSAKFRDQLLRTCCLYRQSKESKPFPGPCSESDGFEGLRNLSYWPVEDGGRQANRHPCVVPDMGRLGGWEWSPSSYRGRCFSGVESSSKYCLLPVTFGDFHFWTRTNFILMSIHSLSTRGFDTIMNINSVRYNYLRLQPIPLYFPTQFRYFLWYSHVHASFPTSHGPIHVFSTLVNLVTSLLTERCFLVSSKPSMLITQCLLKVEGLKSP